MSVHDLLEEAAGHREKGDAKAAINVLLDAAEQAPGDPLVHELIASAYESIGQDADAIEHWRQAIAGGIDGEDRLRAFISMGSGQRALGRYDDAATTFETCLGEFPDSRAAQTFAAMVRYNRGDAKGAFEQLLDLHAATSGDAQVREWRGQLQLFAEDVDAVYG